METNKLYYFDELPNNIKELAINNNRTINTDLDDFKEGLIYDTKENYKNFGRKKIKSIFLFKTLILRKFLQSDAEVKTMLINCSYRFDLKGKIQYTTNIY